MASQIKQETENTPTPTFDEWFKSHFTDLEHELSDGPPIECIDITGRRLTAGINDTGILFSGCKPDGRGEDLMSGNPVGFVHMSSVYPYVHADSREGILAQCEQPCFILPLCQLDSAPALVDMMNEAYASFVFCIQGGVWHDITYIAHGISSGLAIICHTLCAEIAHAPENAVRMHFLVEALYCLALTAHSTAKYSRECNRIFTMMPYDTNTSDILQSSLLSFIFDETPCEAIRVKHLASVISRHFSENGKTVSYVNDKSPYSLMCILMIAPMLGSLLTMDLSTCEIVEQITSAYNQAMGSICNMIMHANIEQITLDRDITNKHVLCSFAMATPVHFVRPELTDRIYEAVVNGSRDIASAVGVQQHANFVNQVSGFTLNGELSNNFPVLIKIENDNLGDNFFATYCSTDPSKWTALSLRTGAKYVVSYTPLTNSHPTIGDNYASIMRFSTGHELMNGDYPWYTNVYNSDNSNSNSTEFFILTTLRNSITVEHNDKTMLHIRNHDGRYLDPTLCFMNCIVSIKLVKNFFPEQPIHCASESIDTIDTIDETDTTYTKASAYESEIMHYCPLPESIRKTTHGQHHWGQHTASVLKGTH